MLDVAQLAVDHGRQLGIAGISALATESAGMTIQARAGAIESSVRDGGHSLSITAFEEGRVGIATTEAIDANSVRRAVEKASAIARAVQPDAGAGLPEIGWLAASDANVELFAPSGRSPADLTAIALSIEQAALDIAARAGTSARVETAAASSADMRWALVTSDNFARASSASVQSRTCAVFAERDEDRVTDWWNSSERDERALLDIGALSGEAVSRTIQKLGARPVATQSVPVLLDPRIAASFVLEIVGALNGDAQQQRSSFLTDTMGTLQFADHVDLEENPLEPFGMASAAWDREGVAPKVRHIVRAGVIEGYFLNSRSARKLGLSSTGSADGPTNLTLTSRSFNKADTAGMCRLMHRGLWVTRILGGQVNLATGNYSKAVEGFWVENGSVVHPVHDLTIAGELPRMLKNIVAVGIDLHRQNAARSGAILFEDMRVAGR